MIYLKEKYAKKNQKQKIKNAFTNDCKRILGDVGVIGCALKVIVSIKQL